MALTKAHNRMISGSMVNVVDYGATGDGTTDDTSAVQAAIATGQSVFFPKGTYLISDQLTVETTGQMLVGDGLQTVIKNSTTSDIIIYVGGSSNVDKVQIKDLTIEGNALTTYGLKVQGNDDSLSAARNGVVENVYFDNISTGAAVYLSAWVWRFVGVKIISTNFEGFIIGDGCNSTMFDNVYITGCEGSAIRDSSYGGLTFGTAGLSFIGCVIQNSGVSTGCKGMVSLLEPRGISFYTCYFENVRDNGPVTSDVSYVEIGRTEFTANDTYVNIGTVDAPFLTVTGSIADIDINGMYIVDTMSTLVVNNGDNNYIKINGIDYSTSNPTYVDDNGSDTRIETTSRRTTSSNKIISGPVSYQVSNSIINYNNTNLAGFGILTPTAAVHARNAGGTAFKGYRPTTSNTADLSQLASDVGGTDTTVWKVEGNGNTYNITGTYGTISDINLKQDIASAGSQWSDIKSLEVVNYKLNSLVETMGDDAPSFIGVIAQQLEGDGMSGLVSTDEETGIKAVKYSVLYMKAVKALQEAMDRIEQLEARVATLEP